MRDTAASTQQKSQVGNMLQGQQARTPGRGRGSGREAILEVKAWVENALMYSVSEAQFPGLLAKTFS